MLSSIHGRAAYGLVIQIGNTNVHAAWAVAQGFEIHVQPENSSFASVTTGKLVMGTGFNMEPTEEAEAGKTSA